MRHGTCARARAAAAASGACGRAIVPVRPIPCVRASPARTAAAVDAPRHVCASVCRRRYRQHPATHAAVHVHACAPS
eukprot:2170588-Pleurochrysis_carterae.AAC.1